jgi:hypothetical protein
VLVDEPVRIDERPAPLFTSARVEGFEARVLTEDERETSTHTDIGASGFTDGDWGGHVRHARSERTWETWRPTDRYLQVAVHALEDSRAFVVVNTDTPPRVILRGAIGGDASSYGQLWTIPVNAVLSIGLGLLPWTWGQESEVRMRAYSGDGRFLREYRAEVGVRSWHTPYEEYRIEAENERLVRGRELAVRRVIAEFLDDLAAHDFDLREYDDD